MGGPLHGKKGSPGANWETNEASIDSPLYQMEPPGKA